MNIPKDFSIYKYELDTGAYICSTIKTPNIIRTLKIDVQNEDNVCLWCLVDLDTPEQERKVVCYPTGAARVDRHSATEYIDTVIMPNGLVWHYFWHQRY